MTEKTAMIKQIESVPGLMKLMEPELKNAVKEFLTVVDSKRFHKIILSGCGDSFCSVMAAKFAFMKYTDLETEVATIMDLSRVYEKKDLIGRGDTLVLVVSNSGNVKRIIELAKRIRNMNGFIAAVTGNENSELYKTVNAAVKIRIPSFVYAPGIRSYCGCLNALIHLAVEIGIVRNTISREKAECIYQEIEEIAEVVPTYMGRWEKQCAGYADWLSDSTSFEFIGSGVHYASAWFGCAKSLETTGKPSSAVNTEDWFHMNFFVRDVSHTGTILCISKQEGGLSRAQELIRIAEDMGRPFICITDFENTGAKREILTPRTKSEELSCLIQYLPISILMADIGEKLGEVYFRDGKDNWSACENCGTLINSEEVILD